MASSRGQRIQEVAIRPGRVDMRKLFRDQSPASFGPGKSAVASDRPTKSKFIDALDFFGAYRGVKEKHTRITFEVLRRMAKSCGPMGAIVQLRCNQAASFARKPRYESDTGFRITTRDPEQKLKDSERKEIRRLEGFLLNTGFEPSPHRRDNLDTFLRKVVRDTLILDAYAVEIVPGQNAKKFPVAEMWAIDAATIRFAEEENYRPVIEEGLRGEVAYIQEIDGRIEAEYTQEELSYGVRNPHTDVDSNGYGCSELENSINIITGILYGEQYNRSYFSTNSTPRGIISVVGDYGEEALEGFKRAWRAQLEGAMNWWRTPIMAMEAGQGINFIPLDQKGNRDMEYHLWLDYLINSLCAAYCVNPQELGYKGYQPQGASMNEASPKDQIEQGEDKGLGPLMANIGNQLNSAVLWRINPDFAIEWEGLRADDRMAKQQYYLGWLEGGVVTVNEVREEALDKKPLKGKWADVAPAQQTLYQAYAAEEQAKQMAQQPSAATAGGPMMPPNGNLNAPGQPGDKQAPGPPGMPPKPPGMPGPPPKPPGLPGQPPKPPVPGQQQPFGKSLAGEIELVIEVG